MTKKVPARGRPELPKKEKRSVLMQFRVTESEAKRFRSAAKKSDVSLSDWLREIATQNA